jgi:ADP-ribose pyrophosphatase YjhB (NUDIX family)
MSGGPGGHTENWPACYMLIRQDGKLLFVLRTNTGFMDGYYCLPAGRVEADEPFRAGSLREAEEEAGVTVRPEHAKHVYTQHRRGGDGRVWVDVFFEATEWSGEARNAQPEEHGEIAWFDEADLPFDKIMDYQSEPLQRMQQGETYGEFGWPK